jgi:hypothetical protein
MRQSMLTELHFLFVDYIVTADLSLVPGSKSMQADTYKFTSVCSATFDALYDETESRYSTKYAAAAIFAVGLLCSTYIGGKSRRLCTGSEIEAENEGNNFIEMNKVDEVAEEVAIASELSESPVKINAVSDKTKSTRIFPAIFRRQTKPNAHSQVDEITSTTTISVVEIRDDRAATYSA